MFSLPEVLVDAALVIIACIAALIGDTSGAFASLGLFFAAVIVQVAVHVIEYRRVKPPHQFW